MEQQSKNTSNTATSMSLPKVEELSKDWEYLPTYAYYLPIIPQFLWWGLKAHPCFFTAVNPCIEAGGLGLESKFETLDRIPEIYRPKSVLLPRGIAVEEVLKEMKKQNISFPVIVKPDIGFRGLLVKKIDDVDALAQRLEEVPLTLILQEYITAPIEVAVLYYKFPNEQKGQVSSVTLKEFLNVVGDGKSNIRTLILGKDRAARQLTQMEAMYPTRMQEIPAQGEVVTLGVIGNHNKGTRFIDGGYLVDYRMVDVFTHITNQIPGLNYARYDIRCESINDLYTGDNIKILEINGVAGEPVHIYDPANSSYWQAVKTIAKQWKIVGQLGVANHKKGVPYLPLGKMLKALKQLRAYTQKVERISNAIQKKSST